LPLDGTNTLLEGDPKNLKEGEAAQSESKELLGKRSLHLERIREGNVEKLERKSP